MGDHIVPQHEIEVIAGAKAAALARAAVARLGLSQLEERMDAVRLSISEVVTNAVRHGGLRQDIDPVRIIVGAGPDTVRITVEQATAANVQVVQPRRWGEDPGGFGMHLVDQSADDWGYDPGPPGRVWIEFGTPSS